MRASVTALLILAAFELAAIGARAAPVLPGGSAADAVSSLLAERTESFSAIEARLATAKSAKERARLWTLLAFAPLGSTAIPAHEYAAKAFVADVSVPVALRARLAKLAGSGRFERGEFVSAQSLFEAALKLRDLSERDREYFEYQAGWCELNRSLPKLAAQRFARVLATCSECGLRQEISGDYGRAVAEAAISIPAAPVLSGRDGEAFARGYLSGSARRKAFRLQDGTAAFAKSKLLGAWLELALTPVPDADDTTACAGLEALPLERPEVWPVKAAREALSTCVSRAPRDPRPLPIYRALPGRTDEDLAWFAESLQAQNAFVEACGVRLDVATRMGAEPRVVLALDEDAWLARTASACARASKRAAFADRAAATFATLGFGRTFEKSRGLRGGASLFAAVVAEEPAWRAAIERAGAPVWAKGASASLALARAGVLPDIAYQSARDGADWGSLNIGEKAEVVRVALTSAGFKKIASDWSSWSPRLAADEGLQALAIDAAIASGVAHEAAPFATTPVDSFGRLLASLQRLANEGCPGAQPFAAGEAEAASSADRRRDLERLSGSCGVRVLALALRGAAGESEEESMKAAVGGAAKAAKDSASAPWSSKEMAALNRRALKDGFRVLGEELARRKDAGPVAALVRKWGRRL